MNVRTRDRRPARGEAGDRPGGVAQDLQRDVGQRRARRRRQLGDRHHERPPAPLGAGKDLDHGRRGTLADADARCGGRRRRPASHQCTTRSGSLHRDAGRHVDEHGVGREGVVEAHQRVPARCTEPSMSTRRRDVVGPPEGEAGAPPAAPATKCRHGRCARARCPQRAERRGHRGAAARPPPGRGPPARGRPGRTRPGRGRRSACSARPPRSRRAAASTRTPRSRRPAGRGASPGPARPADASALNVCRVRSSFGCECGPCTLVAPRRRPHPAD